jgi:dolichol-phosphate mannosyltransferase
MRVLYVLLPAKDEEESLRPVFANLVEHLSPLDLKISIIVCDDGSRDRTPQILNELKQDHDLTVLTHKINRGLGETIRDLLEYACERAAPGDLIVRLDCDNTHDARYIPSMIEALDAGHDVAIASRFAGENAAASDAGLSLFRKGISKGAAFYMRLFFPIKGVREYTCGFRAYRAEIIQKAVGFYGNDLIQLKGMGFVCTLEKLVKLNLIGARITEVPFVLRYDMKLSSSKMVPTITTLGYFVMLLLYYWPWGGWRSYVRQRLGQMADG